MTLRIVGPTAPGPQPERSHRMGSRSRVARELASRQRQMTEGPSLLIRVTALSVLLTVFFLIPGRLLALAVSAPAVVVCLVVARVFDAGYTPARPVPTIPSPARISPRRVRRPRRRWLLVADTVTALPVLAVAAWSTTSLSFETRLLAIGGATTLLSVVGVRFCVHPHWYRSDPRPHPIAALLRALAGPVAVVLGALIVLPAPWQPEERTVVVLVLLVPLTITALANDQDLTIGHIVALVRNEAQDGRQVVLDETHGALSTALRLLEQRAGELRAASPRIYELAVSANSRLRETLTLADPDRETTVDPETLGAVVNTLALASGARADLSVRIRRLGDDDRDLLRLVLNDLVRAALSRGAGLVSASVRLDDGLLSTTVTDDGPVPAEPLAGLEPLQKRLVASSGEVRQSDDGWRSVDAVSLCASWPAADGTG